MGIGVFVSGLRWLMAEWYWEKDPQLDLAKRATADGEAALQNITHQHYDYYLFHANTLVSLVLLFGAWAAATSPETSTVVLRLGLLSIVGVVLIMSARNARQRFRRKRKRLLGVLPSSTLESA